MLFILFLVNFIMSSNSGFRDVYNSAQKVFTALVAILN